jgi:hypothetical protein
MTKRVEDYMPGTLYTADGSDLWELVGVFDSPAVVFENRHTRERCVAAINSPLANAFKPLAN